MGCSLEHQTFDLDLQRQYPFGPFPSKQQQAATNTDGKQYLFLSPLEGDCPPFTILVCSRELRVPSILRQCYGCYKTPGYSLYTNLTWVTIVSGNVKFSIENVCETYSEQRRVLSIDEFSKN